METCSLRGFLEALENNEQLLHYTEEVMPEPDIRGIARAAADMGEKGPAVMIENIKGYKGKRLAINVHGSWANHAVMLGMDKDTSIKEQFYEFAKRWENKAEGEIKWIENAPCQEIIISENINLYEIIPAFRVNAYDGGFYFSKASIITKDPDDPNNFNKENIGTYRVQMQGPDTLGIQIMPFHDAAIHVKHAEEMNVPLPIAICLGVDPYISLMASAPLEYEQSELKAAAALAGIPQILTKAITADLDIPAYTEIVIEGEIIPRFRSPEGPFGEFPGSYSGARGQLRIQVKAVTYRKDPIFENLYVGRPWTEHDTLIGLNTSVPIYLQLKETMPEVKAVNAIYQHGLTIIISTDCRFGGYAKSVAMRLASTPHGINYAKNIILVDSDVDPFDMTQVMWALSTRVRPGKDVIVINNVPGMPLDPCSEPPGMGGKLIIDATTPVSPDEVLREVRMVDSIPETENFKKILYKLQRESFYKSI